MEQTMNYPVVIHKERKSDYGVSVPDLPGGVSTGAGELKLQVFGP